MLLQTKLQICEWASHVDLDYNYTQKKRGERLVLFCGCIGRALILSELVLVLYLSIEIDIVDKCNKYPQSNIVDLTSNWSDLKMNWHWSVQNVHENGLYCMYMLRPKSNIYTLIQVAFGTFAWWLQHLLLDNKVKGKGILPTLSAPILFCGAKNLF